MLEEAHKGLEAMSIAAKAVKDEQWGEAERGPDGTSGNHGSPTARSR